MKNPKKGFISPLLLALVAVLVVSGTYAYVHTKTQGNKSTTEVGADTKATSTAGTAGWKTYTNTKYGYSLSYPADANLQPRAEQERLPDAESMAIQIHRGRTSDIGIEIKAWVAVPVHGDANDVRNPDDKINKGIIEDNKIIKLDLKTFAQVLRQRFVADKNHNFPDKNIGPLQEITFAGRRGYTAAVTGYGYMDGSGSDTFQYIYLDDGKNKFVLQYYLQSDMSKQIIETFKFTK